MTKFKLFLLVSIFALSGCSGVKKNDDGSLIVAGSMGDCTVRVVEIDGYKFAVAVGYKKCAITHIVEP